MRDTKEILAGLRVSSQTAQIHRAGPLLGPFAPSVSVVIPTLNEAENLPYVLQGIPRWLHEVVLVDGRSTDRTVEVAVKQWPNNHIVTTERRKLAVSQRLVVPERRTRDITLRVVIQKGKGKGSALREGFEVATGDIIIMMDADGSNDPSEIPAFLGLLLAGADFVKGSRFLQGGGTLDMPLYRKLGNWSFVGLVRMLFGGGYSDLCYGYNGFWARVAPRMAISAKGFEVETLMNIRALRLGLRIAEVPSFEFKRMYGASRLKTIPDGWHVVRTIFDEAIQHHSRHLIRRTGWRIGKADKSIDKVSKFV
jgi:glycosyltransferase involved in cell wall biosynthesis